MNDGAKLVQALVGAHPAARAVLDRSAPDVLDAEKPRFRAAYARAARLLGAAATEALAGVPASLTVARPHWTLLDWTRSALLLCALEHADASKRPEIVLGLLESGEIGEQESLLRTLPLLPEPARYLEVGLAACRTNARRVFEAIACENEFPAAHFPEHAFNQLVLKAIFIEVPITRIEGVFTRIGADLVRMAREYGTERAAAGRPVPEDVDRILERAPARLAD